MKGVEGFHAESWIHCIAKEEERFGGYTNNSASSLQQAALDTFLPTGDDDVGTAAATA